MSDLSNDELLAELVKSSIAFRTASARLDELHTILYARLAPVVGEEEVELYEDQENTKRLKSFTAIKDPTLRLLGTIEYCLSQGIVQDAKWYEHNLAKLKQE